ncbi:MAG TPA: hypothetical protein EYP28_05840, partial [Methanophagales archaeon]|nr:hypothetical protein [Methanophagales archaeon]
MKTKEAGAIIVALLLVAALAAGVANAETLVLGGEYKPSMLIINSSNYADSLINSSTPEELLTNETEGEQEAEKEPEELPSDWLEEEKEKFPQGYWDTSAGAWQKTMPVNREQGYWDYNPGAWQRTMPVNREQ